MDDTLYNKGAELRNNGCLKDLKVVKDFKDANNPPYLSFPHS